MGGILGGFHDQAPWPRLAMLISPAAFLYGLVGLIYPPAVHDFIRPEFGALQLWLESGRRGFHIGMAAIVIGLLCGIAWACGVV